jgi:methyl-accepting chemotaxis protein
MRRKLSLLVAVLMVISIASLSFVTINAVNDIIEEVLNSDGMTLAKQIAHEVENSTLAEQKLLGAFDKRIISSAYAFQNLDFETATKADLQKIVDQVGASVVYISDASREIKYTNVEDFSGYTYPADHKFALVFDGKQDTYTEDIRVSATTGELTKFGGVNGGNGYYIHVGIVAEDINAIIEEISLQKNLEAVASSQEVVYALLIDDTYTAVAHSDAERIGMQFDDDGTKKAVDGRETFGSIYNDKDRGFEVYDIFYPIHVHGEYFGMLNVGISMEALEVANDTVMKISLMSSAIGVLITLLALNFALRLILNPLNLMENRMNALSKGDFTGQFSQKELSGKDEIASILRSLKEMQVGISTLLHSVISNSGQVEASSTQMVQIAETSKMSTQEITMAIEQIASTAAEQASNVERVVVEANDLGKKISDTNEKIFDAEKKSAQAADLGASGQEIIKILNEMQVQNNEKLSNINTTVDEINNAAENAASIIAFIENISNQTNLLALNASIEAARAGEAGRGFAVVADEIRKLAEDTTNATSEIRELILNIQSISHNAVNNVNEIEAFAKEQDASILKTNETFNDIIEALGAITDSMGQVTLLAKNMDASKEEIISSIESISASTEESSSSSEEVSATTEEQLASMEVVVENATQSSAMITELIQEINKFKI